MAPQPQHKPHPQSATAATTEPPRQGRAQAQPAARQGEAQATSAARPAATGRRGQSASTPRQLRIARGLAATACLLPGLVGMVEIASAATAPVSSSTQTYADLRAAAATFEARAAADTAAGTAGGERAALDLARAQNQVGTAALLYPERSADLYRVSDELGKRQTQLTAAVKGQQATTQGAAPAAQTVPAATESLTNALRRLDDPPASRSVVNRQHVVIAGAVGLVGLLGASIWLARKTKRIINPGLIGGALLTAGVSTLGYLVLTTSSALGSVDDIATVRAAAAQSVAVEAKALTSATPNGVALRQESASYLDTGTRLVGARVSSWGDPAGESWATFTSRALTADGLTAGLAARQKAVAGRLGDLDTLGGRLAAVGKDYGAGSDRRPNAWAGYGIFALSLVAGGAAWTGVGRRVAEYR